MVGFGLGVNIFSSFPMLTVLGAIGAFMMFVALICDVYLLPSLLVLLERD